MSLGVNNNLICLGSSNHELWKQAADAAKAVLDWAAANGHHLITDQGVDKNYRYSWKSMTIRRLSSLKRHMVKSVLGTGPGSAISPPNIYPGNRWAEWYFTDTELREEI